MATVHLCLLAVGAILFLFYFHIGKEMIYHIAAAIGLAFIFYCLFWIMSGGTAKWALFEWFLLILLIAYSYICLLDYIENRKW